MLRKRGLALLLILLLSNAALAEQLILPGQLTEVEEEAFSGNSAVREVILPEGVLSIGDGAFSGCENLGWITVPQSVSSLGQDILAGCREDLLIRSSAGSAATLYAQSQEIDYRSDTACRALLIGQTYPDILKLRLNGPWNDVAAMAACLAHFPGTPYQVQTRMNLTADGIFAAIEEALGSAADEDISLIYYSGHGITSDTPSQQGALLGADGESLVLSGALRQALDQIPGRKILIVDACYSGNMIPAGEAEGASLPPTEGNEEAAESFVQSFISAFSMKKRNGSLPQNYFVMTAAAADEESFETSVGARVMGQFTERLLFGCGYNCRRNSFTASPAADVDRNGVLTFQEAYHFAQQAMLSSQIPQHAGVYPADCRWFGLLRTQ